MSSSTSGSEPAERQAAARGMRVVGIALASLLAASNLVALLRPFSSLAPDPDRVARSDHYFVFLGNSRFEAAIDPPAVEAELGRQLGGGVGVDMFTGGGWGVLQYYMLAQLAAPKLRPGRDTVIIEISPFSMNGQRPESRIGAIRPPAAFDVARLPGLPAEVRLDLVFGALCPPYRYRTAFQSEALGRRLDHGLRWMLDGSLGRVLMRPPPGTEAPAFELVPVPGKNHAILEIHGDLAAFRRANRAALEPQPATVDIGTPHIEALRRLLAGLVARRIGVVLLRVPVSTWFGSLVARSHADQDFRRRVAELAAPLGVPIWEKWPGYGDESLYWDEVHMTSAAAVRFSSEVARRLARGSAAHQP